MNLPFLIAHLKELGARVEANSLPADKIAASFFREKKYLGGHDRRFITEHFYAILRHRRFLETMLERYAQEHHDAGELQSSPQKYISLYIVYRTAVGHESNETIPHSLESFWKENFSNIELPVFLRWLNEHQNLDGFSENDISNLGIKFSFPDWMVKEWHEEFGSETEQLLQALNAPSKISLRVNLLKTSREECQHRLLKEGIETEVTIHSSAGLIAHKRFNRDVSRVFKEGWFEFQEEGSQLISYLASPKSGDVVIDACAGAGGKTLHLAELMKNSGKIIAVDVEQKYLDEVRERARRAGVKIIQTMLRDESMLKQFFGKADLVLVDAPCSGSGTIRRNPDKKWAVTEAIIQKYADEQLKVLEFNSNFVRTGGKLVYATCSLFRAENEDVVNSFLDVHKNFELVNPAEKLKSLKITSNVPTVKFLPHRHDTDGFFVAIMKRIE